MNPSPTEYRKTATLMAVQFLGQHVPGVCTGGDGCKSKGAPDDSVPHIHTLEGDLTVSHGDWIATGVQGEHWAIKPDVFAASYAPASAQPPLPGGIAEAEFVLVPRKPTEAISDAFFDAKNATYGGQRWVCRDSEFKAIYRAMLAAVPPRPMPTQEQREAVVRQPIETAPKNATDVIVFVPTEMFMPKEVPVIAHWAHGGGEDQPPFGPGWFRYDGYKGFVELRKAPTHWMPLPASYLQRPDGERS